MTIHAQSDSDSRPHERNWASVLSVASLVLALVAFALLLVARSNTDPTPECGSHQAAWIDGFVLGSVIAAAVAVVAGVSATAGAASRRRTTLALLGVLATVVAIATLVVGLQGYECASMAAFA
jgi:hypothetical protein